MNNKGLFGFTVRALRAASSPNLSLLLNNCVSYRRDSGKEEPRIEMRLQPSNSRSTATSRDVKAAVQNNKNINKPKDPADVIRICDAHGETLDVAMKGMQVGLLIGHEGALQDAFPLDIFSVAFVVEETIVLHNYMERFCT
ncbi:hypothetical protein SRHO_G00213770 [Serrasalmus rhombeus]